MSQRRSNKVIDFDIGVNTTINTAQFSHKNDKYIIAGDSNNCVQLFNLKDKKPVCVFYGPTSENTNYITSVTFGEDNNRSFSGSFRGSISMLDLHSQKIVSQLNGHTTQVTCLNTGEIESCGPGMLISGSCDTTVKIWDVRTKSPSMSFTGHHAQINDVRVSPDGAWLATCGNDNKVYIWDIKTGSIIMKFDYHDAPVTCIKFNPQDLAIAAGGNEKFVTYYSLENEKDIKRTTREACTIDAIEFDNNGELIFSASQNSLKVWDVKTCKLIHNYDAKWSGVKDIKMTSDNSRILGVAAKANELSLWVSDQSSNPISPPTSDILSYQKNITPPQAYQLAPAQISKGIFDESTFQKVSESMINENVAPSKYQKDYDMIEEIQKEHSKFIDLMSEKVNYLKPIVHWMNSGNLNAAINGIEKLKDASIVVDLLNMMLYSGKIAGISIEFATTLLKKTEILIVSDYMIHIKTGLQFVLKCIELFTEQIRTMRSANVLNKVDLAREQRIQKINEFCTELEVIRAHPRVTKLKKRYQNEEVGKLCESCINDISFLLGAN